MLAAGGNVRESVANCRRPQGQHFPFCRDWFILGEFILSVSFAGDRLSQVISCPNCEKKLSLRDELKGRTLVCPQCKGRFTAPSDETPEAEAAAVGTPLEEEPAPSGSGSDMSFLDDIAASPAPAAKVSVPVRTVAQPMSAEEPAPGGSGSEMSFLDNLAASPAPATKVSVPVRPTSQAVAAAEPAPSGSGSEMGFLDDLATSPAPATKAATKASVPMRSAAKPASATAKSSTLNPARAAASRAKKQSEQMMMVYIGGGIGAAILVVVLIVIAMNSGTGARNSSVKRPDNIRFGLKETVRRQLFMKLVSAVDSNGITKECKKAWLGLADEYHLDRLNIKDVIDEGLNGKDWDLPELKATMSQEEKQNRISWIRTMNETKREPIMGL
jgi:hypothetical protein